MLELLFSLGSRKLDDWLPATTTSCTWEAVFSPIPTYYFPFPSYASGQPASFFFFFLFLFFSSGPGGPPCVGLSRFHSGWDQIGPIQMLPLKIVCGGQNTLAFWSPTPPCQVNGPLWGDWDDSDGVQKWMFPFKHRKSLTSLDGSPQTNRSDPLKETTCYNENILWHYGGTDRIQVGVNQSPFWSDLWDIRPPCEILMKIITPSSEGILLHLATLTVTLKQEDFT